MGVEHRLSISFLYWLWLSSRCLGFVVGELWCNSCAFLASMLGFIQLWEPSLQNHVQRLLLMGSPAKPKTLSLCSLYSLWITVPNHDSCFRSVGEQTHIWPTQHQDISDRTGKKKRIGSGNWISLSWLLKSHLKQNEWSKRQHDFQKLCWTYHFKGKYIRNRMKILK